MDEKMDTAALKQELATAKHELAEARAYIRRRILAEEEPARKAVAGRVSKTDELGKRAVACKHFYWTQGMLTDGGRRVGEWRPDEICGASEPANAYPDLNDPATMGCLLYLVREAWGVEPACVWWNEHDQGWVADVRPRNLVFVRDSEAHALVAALEAAP